MNNTFPLDACQKNSSELLARRTEKLFKRFNMMPGDTCIVFGKARKSKPTLSFHRFPKDAMKRAVWLNEFGFSKNLLKTSTRVCSRHFHDGNPHNEPHSSVGKRFASPLKDGPRKKRVKIRQLEKDYQEAQHCHHSSSSRSVTPSGFPAAPSSSMVG